MKYNSLKEFYPYYLSEHQNVACRRLHFVGTSLVIGLILYFALSGNWKYWWLIFLAGYGFAWVGHFFFEHNRPATFKNPFYSLASDFIMYKDMLVGKIKF